MDDLVFKSPYDNRSSDPKPMITLSLLDIEIMGIDCGEETAAWVSSFLGGDLRLVQQSKDDWSNRKARAKYLKSYPRTFKDNCVPGKMNDIKVTFHIQIKVSGFIPKPKGPHPTTNQPTTTYKIPNSVSHGNLRG